MGLKQRKRKANEYALGKEWTWNGDSSNNVSGFKQRITSNGGGIATGAVNFIGSTMDAFGPVKDSSNIVQESGYNVSHGTEFDYQRYNNVDQQRHLAELSSQNTTNTLKSAGAGAALGASVGSLFPGLGTVIGGVVGGLAGGIIGIAGGNSRRRKLMDRIRTAQNKINVANADNYSVAATDYLQNKYNLEHENTQDDQIFSAKHGKDLKQPIR